MTWKFIILCFLIYINFNVNIQAQSIQINGNWNLNIPSTNITEAGNDFSNPFTSAGSSISIDLLVWPKNRHYEVLVNRLDVNWNPALILSVTRTSSGTNPDAPPPGSITGGTTPVIIETSQTTFFSGQRSRVDVNIMYNLSGVSVTLPAATYSTTVVYTMVQL